MQATKQSHTQRGTERKGCKILQPSAVRVARQYQTHSLKKFNGPLSTPADQDSINLNP